MGALDHNAIGDLDEASWLALAWFVMMHHTLPKKELVKLPGELVDTRLLLDLRMNLWQNPLANLVTQAGGISEYVASHSRAILATVQLLKVQ